MARGTPSSRSRRFVAALALLGVVGATSIAQAEEKKDPKPPKGYLRYTREGLTYESRTGHFRAIGTIRLQWRLSYPFDPAPLRPSDFDIRPGWEFQLRRARARVRGHLGRDWMDYMLQYDLRNDFLRDYRLTVKRLPWLQPVVGQYKVNYSRERVASSGAQQFAERSIVNRVFTVDRQIGISLRGELMPRTRFSSEYTIGVFNGTGRAAANDDDWPMFSGKYQWNMFGEAPGVTMGDPEYHEKPAGALAVAAAWNRSPYTRWNTDNGGRQLVGFEPGQPGQYTVTQALLEGAYKFRGFSTQGELHWKQIDDNVNDTRTTLLGGYAQAGYFFHGLCRWVPRPLEVALRVALVDDDVDVPGNTRGEYSAVLNWFFNGHRNKLTASFSYLTLGDPAGPDRDAARLQLQWDLTF